MKALDTVNYETVGNIDNDYDYNQVVLSTTDSVIYMLNKAIQCQQVNDKDDLEELLNDRVLHEVIDGCEWVIYNRHHLPIIQYSKNDEYMLDNFGSDSLEASLKENGLSGLHSAMAFWALYADVSERVHDILSDYESE